jgi:hypothetical protein
MWKVSKAKTKEFAEKMNEIEQFVSQHNISASSSNDSYYFKINGIDYRVSNHSVRQSNAHAYNFLGNQIRDKYHEEGENIIEILASKTRIIEIYTALKNGQNVDKRGNII